jgi:hypothetical protein
LLSSLGTKPYGKESQQRKASKRFW